MRGLRSAAAIWLLTFSICISMLAGTFSLSGCAGNEVNEDDPAALYKDAEEDIESDHYQVAIDKLRTVKNKFPYSKYSLDAEVRIADVYFMQDNYLEAAMAYESFRDLHPKHERLPYVMFRIGLSYYKDIPGTVARDLSSANKAQDAFNEYLRRFQDTPEKPEAIKYRDEARGFLADKELQIANFYYKRDYYDSAKGRYSKILNLYPETDAAREAQVKLNKIADIKKEE